MTILEARQLQAELNSQFNNCFDLHIDPNGEDYAEVVFPEFKDTRLSYMERDLAHRYANKYLAVLVKFHGRALRSDPSNPIMGEKGKAE